MDYENVIYDSSQTALKLGPVREWSMKELEAKFLKECDNLLVQISSEEMIKSKWNTI